MTSPAQPVRIPKYLPPGPSSSDQPIVSGPSTGPRRSRPSNATSQPRTGPASHSPRAGTLPDGRELFVRKPNMRRNWEPVRDHFCESCGGLYPRTPFDWEEVGFKDDGTRFSALRKRCSGCTFPGLTKKLNSDRSKAVEGFIRQLHPNFNLPEQLRAGPTPVNQNHRNPQGHQVNNNNISLSKVVPPAQPHRFVQTRPGLQPLTMRPQETLIPRNGKPPVPSAPSSNEVTAPFNATGPSQTTPNRLNIQPAARVHQNGVHHAPKQTKIPPILAPAPSRPVPGSAATQSSAGLSRTSPRKPSKLVPTPTPVPKRTSTPRTQPTEPSSEMFEALRRAFERNPAPSPDVLELLAVTFNISDVRVLDELFKVWRQRDKKSTAKSSVKAKGFERGSLEMNGQGTPDSSFANGGSVEGDDGDDLARQEQDILQRIGVLEYEGMERDVHEEEGQNAAGPEMGNGDVESAQDPDKMVSRSTIDSTPIRTIAPHSFPRLEDSSGLRSNGLLDTPISDEAMQIDGVQAADQHASEVPVRPADEMQNGTESHQSETADLATHKAPRSGAHTTEEAMQVVIPGMGQNPGSTPAHSGRSTPVSMIENNANRSIKNTSDPNGSSAWSLSIPPPATTPPPQQMPRATSTLAGPASRPAQPPAKRPKEGVTIVDCPVHEVKHMSDPILQRAYEIFTCSEPTRLANWLRVVFKPASEKYSVMQKDVYTEYKGLFEGSTEPCATGQQVVRMCLDIWPELKLGKRLDQPSQFRMWGLYRVRVYSGSPWEALYNGELKRKLGLSNTKAIEMAPSESGVLRVGAPIDSLASALSTARLDQGKMRILSDGANGRDTENFIKGFPISDSLPTWQTKTTPKGAAVTSHRLSKLNKVYWEPTIRPRRERPKLSACKEISRMRRIINPMVTSQTPVNGSSQSHTEISQPGPSTAPVDRNYLLPSGTNHASQFNPTAMQASSTQYQYRAPLPPQAQQYQGYPTGWSGNWQYANSPPFPQPR